MEKKCKKREVENGSRRPADVKSFIRVIGLLVKQSLMSECLVLANILVFLFLDFNEIRWWEVAESLIKSTLLYGGHMKEQLFKSYCNLDI